MDNNMKRITLILIIALSLVSFTTSQNTKDIRINPVQYDLRLQFIQDRCRMLEDMFEKQYEKEQLEGEFAFFYMQMVRSMDSCASDLKQFKVLFK